MAVNRYNANEDVLEKIFDRAIRRAYSLIGAMLEYTASGLGDDLAEIRLLFKEMLKQLKLSGFVAKAQGGWQKSSVKQWETELQTPLQVFLDRIPPDAARQARACTFLPSALSDLNL